MTSTPRRRLGATDLHVFPICLGGNVFGWTADRAASFAVLDAYREAGGNFVDSADVYSKWAPGHVGGESEEMLGAWLRERRCRDEMVIATKVGMGGPGLEAGLTAAQIRAGCEASLRRLGVERIDLYYAHKEDEATPLEESLRAFDELVRAGKVRHLGSSNTNAARLGEALEVSEREGLAAYAVVQQRYNLAERGDLDGALAALCTERGLGVCTFHALAAGFFTGKYRPGSRAEGARAKKVQALLDRPEAVAALERLLAVSREKGVTPAQLALAWQLHHPVVTTPLASATSAEQLHELLGAVEVRLSPEERAALGR